MLPFLLISASLKRFTNAISPISATIKIGLLVFCVCVGQVSVFGQFQLTKTVDSTTISTGRSFGYTLKYSCTNVAGNCSNIVVTDTIPAGLIVESTVGTVHTINNGTISGNQVTFTFIDPMPAGSTGDLRIMVRFPNGSTPDGTMVQNTGYITDGITKLASISPIDSTRS